MDNRVDDLDRVLTIDPVLDIAGKRKRVDYQVDRKIFILEIQDGIGSGANEKKRIEERTVDFLNPVQAVIYPIKLLTNLTFEPSI